MGIIVPRIMIINYGSDANGLLGTVAQLFTYMALLEAGIGQATKNSLYKPLIDKDSNEISYIVSVAIGYYKRISVYYCAGVILIAIIAPFVINTNVSHLTVAVIVILEGLSGVISFYFCQTASVLFMADGRGYVNNTINFVNKTVINIAKILLAILGINIIILELVCFILAVLRVIIFLDYFKKHYSYINIYAIDKKERLKDRRYYIITELAWTVFSSTDMIVISIFISTSISSVYGVYNMVFLGINTLLNAVYNSINYALGQTYHKDIEKYKEFHDNYTSIFLGSMTCLMSTAYIMTIPFVKLYTEGISDVNYLYSSALPLMLSLIQIISWSRYITGNLSGIAGYARITSYISIIEAIVNVSLSIALVKQFGIEGVLFATLIALPIKVIFLTILSEYKILKRNPVRYLIILFSNYVFFFTVVLVSQHLHFNVDNYISFFVYGLVVFVVCSLFGVLFNCLVNRKLLSFIKGIVRNG